MARRAIMALAVVSSLSLGGSALAQASGSGSGSGGGSSTPVQQGDWSRVQSVDKDAGKITVESGRPLKVDDSTRVTRDGTQASLDDVQPGDDVRAAYLHGQDEGPITQLEVRSQGQTGSPQQTGTGSTSK